MAILRMREISELDANALAEKLGELKRELSIERSAVQGVGRKANPGRIRTLKRTIARILTLARAKNMKLEPWLGARKAEAKGGLERPEEKKAGQKKAETESARDDFSAIMGEVKKEKTKEA